MLPATLLQPDHQVIVANFPHAVRRIAPMKDGIRVITEHYSFFLPYGIATEVEVRRCSNCAQPATGSHGFCSSWCASAHRGADEGYSDDCWLFL